MCAHLRRASPGEFREGSGCSASGCPAAFRTPLALGSPPLAVTPTLGPGCKRPRRGKVGRRPTSPAQRRFPGKVRRPRAASPRWGREGGRRGWGTACLRGSSTGCWTRLAESVWGRAGEGKTPERGRPAPRGQERTDSRRGGDAHGDPVLSSRGGAWSPAVGASDAERAGPAAPRCGGGRAELRPRWRCRPTRGEPRSRLPPDGAQRGTRARTGRGFSVRTLRHVPGSFLPPSVSFSPLHRPRSEGAPREAVRGEPWGWASRVRGPAGSGTRRMPLAGSRGCLSPGLTPLFGTSGYTTLGLSYGAERFFPPAGQGIAHPGLRESISETPADRLPVT